MVYTARIEMSVCVEAIVAEAGIALWKKIGAALAEEIERGTMPADARLPSSETLAARFGVNRHTVLKAIAHLQSQGLVRMERGRGAYAVVTRMPYALGAQTWYEQNLLDSHRTPSRTVLSVLSMPAPEDVARALKITAGREVCRVTLLGEADGMPINYGHHYFPLARVPGIDAAFLAFGTAPTRKLSFSKILKSVGVKSFRRKRIRVRSLPAEPDQARYLRMAPTEHVLLTEVTSVNPGGTAIVHAYTYFCSSRIEFVIDL